MNPNPLLKMKINLRVHHLKMRKKEILHRVKRVINNIREIRNRFRFHNMYFKSF